MYVVTIQLAIFNYSTVLIDYGYVMLHVSLSTFLHIAVQLNELLKLTKESMPVSFVTSL